MVRLIVPLLAAKRNLRIAVLSVFVFGLCALTGNAAWVVSADHGGGSGGTNGGGGGGGANEPANQLEVKVTSATVPAGGMLQLQIGNTEPKPIGTGGPRFGFSSAALGTAVGAAVNSPSGEACGVVLATSSGYQVAVISPDGTWGNNTSSNDYPLMVLSLPVSSSATAGSTVPLSLASNSVFTDPSGNSYPLELKSGTMTVGGSLSITNVLPGGGTVAAGSKISILGVGFTSGSTVTISGASLATTDFVSSSEIDVTLTSTIVLDTAAVQVTDGSQTVTYFSYLRANDSGPSSQSLLAASHPMFSLLTYTNASLPWITSSTVFTGLSLQNGGSTAAAVTLELVSGGQVQQTVNLSLASMTKLTRDLTEFFGQPPSGSISVTIQSSQPIQLLGIQGDTSAGTLTPVIVTNN